MHRALATVDLEAVRHNVAGLCSRLAPESSLMAVVKANGYGHGAAAVAGASLEGGAACLGVATAAEAAELRATGLECPVVVLGPLTGSELKTALDANAEVILWTLPFLKTLIGAARERERPAPVHVKVDTGMRRLGIYPRDLPEMLDAVATSPEAELKGLMTHFATADEDDDAFFHSQLKTFEDAAAVVMATGAAVRLHCANSAATMRYPQSHFDMVRCGIAIYGLSPFQGDASGEGLKPALSLTSYLADIKPLAAGDSVGYGCTWTAAAATNIGVVPIGYADGVSRGLSNHGRVLAGGRSRPIVGRVSMDQITVDLGPDPGDARGDEVVLIGSQEQESVTAEEVAGLLGTINYEVTCNISPRVERKYRGSEPA